MTEVQKIAKDAYGALKITSKEGLLTKAGVNKDDKSDNKTKPGSKTSVKAAECEVDGDHFNFEIVGTDKFSNTDCIESARPIDIELKRENKGKDDKDSILVFIHDCKVGYVPKKAANILFPMLESGADVRIEKIDVSYRSEYKHKKQSELHGELYGDPIPHKVPVGRIFLTCKKSKAATTIKHSKPGSSKELKSKSPVKEKSKEINKRQSSIKSNEMLFLGAKDCLVKSHGHRASHKNHELEPVEATINIIARGPALIQRSFTAFYCFDCDKCYITDETFTKLRRYGSLGCQVYEEDSVLSTRSRKGFAANLADESPLHAYGYNVNKDEDLSDSERRIILSFVIENNVMSQYEIVSFLQSLITRNKNNDNFANAISRWKSDIEFLENYKKPKYSLKVKSVRAKRC